MKELLPSGAPEPPTTTEDLNCMVDVFTNACNRSFNAACPKVKPRGKQRPAWWSQVLEIHRKACRIAFNKAKKSGKPEKWDSYKEDLRQYKRELRKVQRSSWRLFCDKIEEVSETSRLRKILSKNANNISYLMKPDGSWTASSKESLELLMETHFPKSFDDSFEIFTQRVVHSLCSA